MGDIDEEGGVNYRIIETRPGWYGVQKRGKFWGWNWVCDSKDGLVWEFASLKRAEEWVDGDKAESGHVARVVATK